MDIIIFYLLIFICLCIKFYLLNALPLRDNPENILLYFLIEILVLKPLVGLNS